LRTFIYVYSKTLEQLKHKLIKRIISELDGFKIHTFFKNYIVILQKKKKMFNSMFLMNDVITVKTGISYNSNFQQDDTIK